jgi:hypothetical protein
MKIEEWEGGVEWLRSQLADGIKKVTIFRNDAKRVNSRPMCTSDSRLDVYHQKEYGGGQDSGFIGASEVVLIETNSFLQQ